MSGVNLNSLFGTTGGLAGMLGDYQAIKNGSYSKLMKSYYGDVKTQTSGTSGNTAISNVLDRILEERRNPTVSKEVSTANTELSASVASLKNALGTLQNENTYKDTENGSTGRSKALSALKSYVSSYNDAVISSKKSTMSNVSSNVAGMMKASKEHEEELKKLGITINNNGTLTFNEKKFETAELNDIKDIFDGNKALSYGSKAASRLNRASYYTETTATSTSNDTTVSQTTVSSSKNLMESIANLKGDALFAKTVDADSNSSINRDGIKSELENFIKYYNATLTSGKNSSVSGVTANVASMMQKTANHSYSLSEIGISIGADGKLSLNNDVFSNASADVLQKNLNAYASSIESNAKLVNYYSTTQNNSSSGYSANGTYSTSASDAVSQLYDQSK